MDRTDFWNFVDEADWATNHTKPRYHKDLKAQIMRLGQERAREMQVTFYDLESDLYSAISEAAERNRSVYIGDDGMSDLVAHIIGLGKEEYDRVMADPTQAILRAAQNDYTEGFQYSFPFDSDFEDYEPQSIYRRAQVMRAEYASLHERLPDVRLKAEEISQALRKISAGQWNEVLEDKDRLKETAEQITNEFRDAFNRLAGGNMARMTMIDGADVAQSKWCFWNILSDMEFSQEVYG